MKAIHYALVLAGALAVAAHYVQGSDATLAQVAGIVGTVATAVQTALGLFSPKVGEKAS